MVESADAGATADDPAAGFAADREYHRLMWVAFFALLAGFVGSVFTVVPWDWCRSLGILVVTAAVGGIGGAAIGFLFGIPRILADGVSPAGAAGDADAGSEPEDRADFGGPRYLASNSNLEQMSDWLTKLILGVGLTQFYQLNGLLLQFGDLIAAHVPPNDRTTPLVATMALVFAVLCGFLTMYLQTRIVLSRVFNALEANLRRDLQTTRKELRVSNRDKREVQGQVENLETAITKIAGAATTSPTMLTSAATWLEAAARSGLASDAIKSIAAQVVAASGRPNDADGLIDPAGPANLRESVAAMQVALYKKEPTGFEEAIAIADRVAAMKTTIDDPEFWLLRAAAFGQLHHYLQRIDDPVDRPRIVSARDSALAHLRQAIRLDPAYKARAGWMMDPETSPTPGDDDLQDFRDDPDFRAAIAP